MRDKHSFWILLRISFLLALIFTLSGCIFAKTSLEKTFHREFPSPELEEVISFVQTCNILEFLNIDSNDSAVFQGFETDNYYQADFVQNISTFLTDAEAYYNRKREFSHGYLRFHITGQNITGINHTEILSLSETLSDSSQYFGPTVRYGNFVAFVPNSSFQEDPEIVRNPSYQDLNDTLERVSWVTWSWLVLAEFDLDVSVRFGGCAGYGFSELLILDRNLSIFFFLAASSFPIC
ncbi:MAG: hypothetical protein JSV04_11130 [Candidatus Heimdallarchaeota archaeon]|nr:MAG: hypothetical protein JSV04_11130 [Candidatus Heimdallarchaeota archaeon]